MWPCKFCARAWMLLPGARRSCMLALSARHGRSTETIAMLRLTASVPTSCLVAGVDGIMNIAILGLTATSYGSHTYLKNFLPHLASWTAPTTTRFFFPPPTLGELDVRQANFRIHTAALGAQVRRLAGALGTVGSSLDSPRPAGRRCLHNSEHGDSPLAHAQHHHRAECGALLRRAISQPASPAGAAVADADDDGDLPAPQPQNHRHFRLGERISWSSVFTCRRRRSSSAIPA